MTLLFLYNYSNNTWRTMKKSLATVLALSAFVSPVLAGAGDRYNDEAYNELSNDPRDLTPDHSYIQSGGYAHQNRCYRDVYSERYIPGTMDSPGYVETDIERVIVPCTRTTYRTTPTPTTQRVDADGNDCTDGKIAGGLLGGGAAAAMSRGDGRWWAIPLGVVVGSAIGCDAAGG